MIFDKNQAMIFDKNQAMISGSFPHRQDITN